MDTITIQLPSGGSFEINGTIKNEDGKFTIELSDIASKDIPSRVTTSSMHLAEIAHLLHEGKGDTYIAEKLNVHIYSVRRVRRLESPIYKAYYQLVGGWDSSSIAKTNADPVVTEDKISFDKLCDIGKLLHDMKTDSEIATTTGIYRAYIYNIRTLKSPVYRGIYDISGGWPTSIRELKRKLAKI